MPIGGADRSAKALDSLLKPARRDSESALGLLHQALLRNLDQPQATRLGGADERVPEQNSLSLVHAEVHREDFLDTPRGHRATYKHSARRNFVTALSLFLERPPHLPGGNSTRRLDTGVNYVSCRAGLQALCGMIGLPGPFFLNQLDAAPVNDDRGTAMFADDDDGCPS
jgi:hypothetical protein